VGSAKDWKSVSAGGEHTVAIRANGNIYAWGDNEYGQLGDGFTISARTPAKIGEEMDWASASAGDHHTVAIKTDGRLYAWGNNEGGQLGNDLDDQHEPIQIETDTDWLSVSAGGWHTTAVKTDGRLYAWGWNGDGQLGIGNNTDFDLAKFTPTQIGNATDWASVDAGYAHSVALKTNGSLWSWGGGGRIGDGTATIRLSPTQEFFKTTDWSGVSAGGLHTIAVKTGGSLHTWGLNNSGQIGNGGTITQLAPVQIWTANNVPTPTSVYSVTFNVIGNSGGTLTATVDGNPISNGDYVGWGKRVVFTAKPSNGFVVREWQHNGSAANGTNSTYSYIINGAATHSVTVKFEYLLDSYTFEVFGLPVGLSIDKNTGEIFGSSNVEAESYVIVVATHKEDKSKKLCTEVYINIGNISPSLLNRDEYRSTPLPIGLSLNTDTGIITATASAGTEGEYTVVVFGTHPKTNKRVGATVTILVGREFDKITLDSVAVGDYVSIPFTVWGVDNLSDAEFRLAYNPNDFELVNASELSATDVLTAVPVSGTDVNIISIKGNGVTFKVGKSGTWTGVINRVLLRAKEAGDLSVTCARW
jgi:hypothetical protein